MLKLVAGIAKLAAAAPWHCAQLLLVLCALAWMLASVGMVAKSPGVVWQALHCAAAAYGIWFAGLSWPVKKAVARRLFNMDVTSPCCCASGKALTLRTTGCIPSPSSADFKATWF